MSAERTAADWLSDHLDAVVTGDAARSPAPDPAIEATVARFFAADDAPGPPSGLAGHLWEELVERAAAVELVLQIPALPANHNGRPTLEATPTPLAQPGSSRPRWVLAQLATAALVLLTLIGSFVAFQGSFHLLGPEQRGVIIPAIDSTPESGHPSGVIAEDIVLRATLERMPPAVGTLQLALYRNRLAPGAEEPVGSQADTGVGNELCMIESGQVTVAADAPVFLTRASANPAATPSLIEPGTTIVLDVGDQLYAPSGVTFRRRNDGLASATLLCFSIGTYGDSARIWASPPGVTYVHGLPFKLLPTFPAVPVEATVHRLTLAPGAELAIRDLRGLELVYVEAGILDLVYAKPKTPATPERSFTIRSGSGTDTFGRTPDQAVLANHGTEPLVLLTASVIPTSVSEGTPQPP